MFPDDSMNYHIYDTNPLVPNNKETKKSKLRDSSLFL